MPIAGWEFKPLADKYLQSTNYSGFLTLKGLVPWKEKAKKITQSMELRLSDRKGKQASKEMLTQQKKLIFKIDFIP